MTELCNLYAISDISQGMTAFRRFGPDRNSTNIPLIIGTLLAMSLLFVWPVPHTISLRELLLVTCLGWFAYLARQRQSGLMRWREIRPPLGFYLLLSLWIVFVAIAISKETAWSLEEIRGQWLKASLAFIAGGLFGVGMQNNQKMIRLALLLMISVLLLHVLVIVYEALGGWPPQGTLRTRVDGLTGGPDKGSYLSNILLCFLLAEAFIRLVFRQRFLPFGNFPLIALISVTFISVYAEAVRNGVAELIVIIMMAAVLAMRLCDRTRRRIIASTLLVFIVVASVVGYLSAREDQRWQTFLETVPLALDAENDIAWISEDMPLPQLASGELVNWSNYSRIARIRAGLSLIADHPWGVGFGRNAFGHAVEAKHGIRTSHSHSGIIDLGIGIGVPGMVLWLAFLGTLWRVGYRGLHESHAFPAVVLLLLTTGYGFRMLVDSTIRDHMLQMFLFLAAFLAVAATGKSGDRDAPAAARAA